MRASLENDPGFALGQQLAGIVLPIAAIAGGFLLAKHLNRNREYARSVKWPIFLGLAIALLFVVGQFNGSSKSSDERAPWIEVNETQLAAPWPQDLDEAATIKAYKNALVASFKNEMLNKGFSEAADKIEAKGQFLRRGDEPLLMISLRAPDVAYTQTYIGVRGNRQLAVGCGQDGNSFDPVSSGCAAKVTEIFAYPSEKKKI